MLEVRRPLSRVLDGPGLLIQRLTAMVPHLDLRNIDPEHLMLSMAESDPDYLTYLDSEGLPRPIRKNAKEEQVWRP